MAAPVLPTPPFADAPLRGGPLALPFGLTYARARLWLGITGVGTIVVLAAAALALDLPARLLPASPAQPVLAAAGAVAGALLAASLVLLPLEVLGGRVVARNRRSPGAWAAGWARGVAVQALVWFAAAALLLAAGRAGGVAGALGAALVLQLALVAGRGPLARLVAPLPAAPLASPVSDAVRCAGIDAGRVRVVASRDEGFVGGWVGLARPALWVPAHWARLPVQSLVAQLVRRRAALDGGWRGLHARGLALALTWNLAGLALALQAPGSDAITAAGLLTTLCWTTLWSFLGLLLLPTPSRRAVLALDAAASRVAGHEAVLTAAERLDAWQDDERTRPAGVEAIFHPVPAPGVRRAALAAVAARRDVARTQTPSGVSATDPVSDAPPLAAHQAARHALYTAWALGSPLARAVHCNVGRPALWVVWPGD